MMKIVPDSNTIISGFLFRGNESKLFELTETGKITVFVSEEILEEVMRVIGRSKFGLTVQEREETMSRLLNLSTVIKPTKKIQVVKEDPTDNKFIECAAEAKAQYIVSGDKHLLKIHTYRNIKIVKTKELLTLLRQDHKL